VKKSGAWYTYDGEQLGQGKENARNFLLKNPDIAAEIETKIKQKLGIGQPRGGAEVAPADDRPRADRPDDDVDTGRVRAARPRDPAVRRGCRRRTRLSASANQPQDEAGPRDPQPATPTVFPGPSGHEGGVGDLSWHPTWTEEPVDAAWEDDIATVVDDAEAALIKRLRTRSLSEREASRFLRERELGDAAIDHVIDRMRSLGYLDDSALAEQLVQHSGVERKGQGRAMLVQTLSAAHPARGHRRGPRCAA
jgi:hypothetical protein